MDEILPRNDFGPLFEPEDDGPYEARLTDPETSQEWAEHMNGSYPDVWRKIEEAAEARGEEGLTYREAEELTGIRGTVTSTSMTKMEKAGILERREREDGKLVRRDRQMVRFYVELERRWRVVSL